MEYDSISESPQSEEQTMLSLEKEMSKKSNFTYISFDLNDNEPKLKYECSKCVKIFENETELNRHFLTSHEDKEHISEICFSEKMFESNKTHIFFNLDDLEPKLEYLCSKCNEIFESESELNRHFGKAHKNKKSEICKLYKCSKCPGLFQTQEYKQQHFAQIHGQYLVMEK